MPKEGQYIQIGDGPEANQEEIDGKLKLFLRIIQALDGGKPKMETGVVLSILKKMVEQELDQVIDVHFQVESGDIEEVKKRLKERYERTGSVEPPSPIPSPVDPSVH